jgi:uncharacterized membrane protein
VRNDVKETQDFLSRLDRPAIVAAIREAESKGLGEIRVHVHHGRVDDPRAAAEKVFVKLGMTATQHRTGCLLFIAPAERAFAVIGDTAIHEKVGDDFWLDARDAAARHFVEGKFTEGIVAAVAKLGDALAANFPRETGAKDVNELPDDVSED